MPPADLPNTSTDNKVLHLPSSLNSCHLDRGCLGHRGRMNIQKTNTAGLNSLSRSRKKGVWPGNCYLYHQTWPACLGFCSSSSAPTHNCSFWGMLLLCSSCTSSACTDSLGVCLSWSFPLPSMTQIAEEHANLRALGQHSGKHFSKHAVLP